MDDYDVSRLTVRALGSSMMVTLVSWQGDEVFPEYVLLSKDEARRLRKQILAVMQEID